MYVPETFTQVSVASEVFKENDSSQILKIFYSLDQKASRVMSIYEIGQGYGIPNKRLYETINIASVLGACTKHEGSLYTWHGLSSIHPALFHVFEELEAMATQKTLLEIFNIGKSPSMEELTLAFLRLCFYLGQPSISIQETTAFFSSFGGKRDSILRRVYCIARVMKLLGLIHHPHYRSDFVIKLSIKQMAKDYYESNLLKSDFMKFGKLFLLNHIDESIIDSIHEERHQIFRKYITKIQI